MLKNLSLGNANCTVMEWKVRNSKAVIGFIIGDFLHHSLAKYGGFGISMDQACLVLSSCLCPSAQLNDIHDIVRILILQLPMLQGHVSRYWNVFVLGNQLSLSCRIVLSFHHCS